MVRTRPSSILPGAQSDIRFEEFRLGPFLLKRADTFEEIEQLHRINYNVFVHEVGQYDDDGSGRHVDKFVHKNVYLICKLDEQAVGMVAVHDQPPFSVAARLEAPHILDELCARPLEVRLLAVRPDQRKSLALLGLLYAVYRFAESGGYSHLIASGITDQLHLYKRIGFRALGPPTKSGLADFVPMVLDLTELQPLGRKLAARFDQRSRRDTRRPAEMISVLPGPPRMAPEVRAAFERPLLYHRSDEFVALFEEVRSRLQELANGMEVILLNGSGTLANDQIAACLQADQTLGEGLLLVNGEFSERIRAQAERAELRFRILSWDWGQSLNLEQISAMLKANPEIDWVWTVHLESSTGVLNDVAGLVKVADGHGCQVYLDAVSSIGAVPIPEGVRLASGVSSKCLGAYPGISFVLVAPGALKGVDSAHLPAYLDPLLALERRESRFTFPSPVLCALHRALDPYSTPSGRKKRYAHYARLGQHVREKLRELGIKRLAPESVASPVITTFEPPGSCDVREFIELCRSWGFELAAHSGYLRERGWVQIATMGDIDEAVLAPLFRGLGGLVTDGEIRRPSSRSGAEP